MSLLKKCILISLGIHVLLLLLFSTVVITRKVARWVRDEPMMPTVNVQLSREMEVKSQVRQQVQNPLPMPPAAQSLLPRQEVESPLPPLNQRLEPLGQVAPDLQQLASAQNPIAPTISAAPPAPDLTMPLLPVEPALAPIRESTPLPPSNADDSSSTRIPGPIDQRLGRATAPILGVGGGSLGAPPASLAQGPTAAGSATGAGTGHPFSTLAPPPPPATLALQTLPPPIIPQAGPTPAGSLLPQRNFDLRQQALQKYGGTSQTEAAVARALAYLSRAQATDGHWTKIIDAASPATDAHDTALTGLALLAFLASNNTPDTPGPYQLTVQHAAAYLQLREGKDGDLRGEGNMYDQGIASLALNEAAAMSNDPRLTAAAHRAAQFILDAQNAAGGWRYTPRDLFSDTSVMGWQVMALHSAERTGFLVPDAVKQKVLHYLAKVSTGDQGMLTGYLTALPTTTMTAEAAFARLLLGQRLGNAQRQEIADFLQNKLPAAGTPNFYYMYYGSLALMQFQGNAWRQWNAATSTLLLSLQTPDGSFSPTSEWGPRGGRVYATALATLTLEVYYRYAPGEGAGALSP